MNFKDPATVPISILFFKCLKTSQTETNRTGWERIVLLDTSKKHRATASKKAGLVRNVKC